MSRTTTKAKRACIDCHFFAFSKLEWTNAPYPTEISCYYPLTLFQRDQFRRGDEIEIYYLGEYMSLAESEFVPACKKGIWNGLDVYIKHHNNLILETDRSDCDDFAKFKPTKSFEEVEKRWEAEQINKVQTVIVPDPESAKPSEQKETPSNNKLQKSSNGKVVIRVEDNCLQCEDAEREGRLLPIQINLLTFLYKCKNRLATRDEIYNYLWKDSYVKDDQITDHVGKLVEAFVKIGFEKEVVKKGILETVRKSSRNANKGGYIFHNNLVILDYD